MKLLLVLCLLQTCFALVHFHGQSNRAVILVLGCHMDDILQDRIQTAISFAEDIEKPITWFLSGGTKHYLDEVALNEATQMSRFVANTNPNWKIQIDTKARNTAENFAYFRKWIESQSISDIYVVTSEFHHERAASILEGVINTPVKWILSPKACPSCYQDEKIHYRNINSDIRSALMTYNDI